MVLLISLLTIVVTGCIIMVFALFAFQMLLNYIADERRARRRRAYK